MRWLWLAALCLIPVAHASIELVVSAPQGAVPLDRSCTDLLTCNPLSITVRATVDCRDLLPRLSPLAPGNAYLPVHVEAPGLTFTGTPALDFYPATECDSALKETSEAKWVFNGSRFLPGLVPINVTVLAAFDPVQADPLGTFAVAPATATTTITPTARVEVAFDKLQVLPHPVRDAFSINVTLLNHGNVDVTVRLEGAGRPSPNGDGTGKANLPLPRGNLTLPNPLVVPRALSDKSPGKSVAVLQYRPVRGHTGRDIYDLTATAVAVLDHNSTAKATATLEVPYDMREGSGPDGQGRVGAEVVPDEPRSASAPIAALLVLLLLGLAQARRNRAG